VLFLIRTLGLDAGTVGAMFMVGGVGFLLDSLLPERVRTGPGWGGPSCSGSRWAFPARC
jgi:hypothetical protein